MIPIPSQLGAWKVTPGKDIFGVLRRAENVNFDKEGYITPSRKTVSLYGSATDSGFGLPLNILYLNGKYLVLTNSDTWELSADLTPTSLNDTETGEATTNKGSDAVIWQSKAYISGDVATDVRSWDGSNYATPGIAITSDSYPHPLEVMGNFSNGALVIGQKNLVLRYNTAHALQATLTLNDDYVVTSLLYRQNNLFIGTKTLNGSKAKVFVWNGSGTSAQQEFEVGADWVYSMCEYGDSFAIVTSAGQILRWNGGGFDVNNPLANFPVFYTQNRWDNNPDALIGKVHMRGMKADGDLLYININGSVVGRQDVSGSVNTNGKYLPDQPSGVWCFDPKVGLYCRHYSTTDGYQSLTASSLGSNILTLSAAIQAQTGDPILVFENGSLTGVDDDTVYYLIVVSTTEVKLAKTRTDALAGTAITLGGAVTNATFRVVSYDQHGELFTWNKEPGGIGLVQADSADPPTIPKLFDTQILWGFKDRSDNTYLNATTAGSGIGFADVVRVVSPEVKENYQKFHVKAFDFFMDSDKVIVRANHKSRQDLPSPVIVGTYSNDITVGSSDTNLDLAEEGDTVVIVSGNGGGQRRKITAKNGDELTLDEAITGASSSDAVIFYIEPHKTYRNTDPDGTEAENVEASLGITSSFVDISIEMRGTMRVPQMQIVNAPHKLTQ